MDFIKEPIIQIIENIKKHVSDIIEIGFTVVLFYLAYFPGHIPGFDSLSSFNLDDNNLGYYSIFILTLSSATLLSTSILRLIYSYWWKIFLLIGLLVPQYWLWDSGQNILILAFSASVIFIYLISSITLKMFDYKIGSEKFISFHVDMMVILITTIIAHQTEYQHLAHFIFWYYFIGYIIETVVRFVTYSDKEPDNNSDKRKINLNKNISYFFGEREEVDKEIALLLLSGVIWVMLSSQYLADTRESSKLLNNEIPTYIVEISPVNNEILNVNSKYSVDSRLMSAILSRSSGNSKDRLNEDIKKIVISHPNQTKKPKNYFLILFLWSAMMLLMSLVKHYLKFQKKSEIENEFDKDNFKGRYHRGFGCSDSRHEKFCKLFDKETKSKINWKLYSSSLYELGKKDFLNGKVPEALKKWDSSLNLKGIHNSLTGEKEALIDRRCLNDLGICLINDKKDLEIGIDYLFRAHQKGSVEATYNLALALLNERYIFKVKDNDSLQKGLKKDSLLKGLKKDSGLRETKDIAIYLLQCASKKGHKVSELILSDLFDDNCTISNYKYRMIADRFSQSMIHTEIHFRKPVELFISVLSIMFTMIGFYLVLTIFQHPQSSGVGIGIASIGIFSFAIGIVFKSSIQSFIAGIRVYLDDLARVGDRIEIKALEIIGRVEGFTLTNIRIRNLNNSVSSIPLTDFLSASIVNWRSLDLERGRLIKRSVMIDINSIKVFGRKSDKDHDDNFERMLCLPSLCYYLECKEGSLNNTKEKESSTNKKMYNGVKILKINESYTYPDRRNISNIGLYRAYIEQYLHDHDFIDSSQDVIVSQLDPTPEGLPLEVYAYTMNSNEFTGRKSFFDLQTHIFEHIISVAEYFEIKLFQYNQNENDQSGVAARKKITP